MLDPDDPSVRAAVFGKQVEDWLETDIGKYLVMRAEAQAEEAIEKLKRCAPWRTRRLRDLQNDIRIAESIQQWLADAIVDGRQAMKLLEGEDQ